MKNLFFVASLFLLFACGDQTPKTLYGDLELNSPEEKISFSIGADMASNLKNLPDSIFRLLNLTQLESGYVDGYNSFTEEMNSACEEKMKSIIKPNMVLDTSEYSMSDFSYCYGNFFGDATKQMLEGKKATEYFDMEIGRKGFARNLIDSDTSLIKDEERVKIVEDFYNDLTKKASEKLLSEAKARPEAKTISEDVVLEVIAPSNGEVLQSGLEYKMILIMQNSFGDTVLATIKDFNAGDDVNSQVLQFDDRRLVEGWKDAISEMNIGGEYRVTVGSQRAFGDEGLRNPSNYSFIFQPFETIVITSKVIRQNEIGAIAKKRGEELISSVLKKPNTKKYPEGYVIETLKEGSGAKVKPGSDVQAHYILFNSSLEELQNSYQMSMQNGGQPMPFNLNGVVKGWTLGVPNMQVGGKYRLYVPYNLGYGESGNNLVEPYETLVFEMEIFDFAEAGTFVQPQNPMMGGR